MLAEQFDEMITELDGHRKACRVAAIAFGDLAESVEAAGFDEQQLLNLLRKWTELSQDQNHKLDDMFSGEISLLRTMRERIAKLEGQVAQILNM